MLCMARARRRSARPSGLDPLRVNRSHFARRSVAAACPHRAHRLERLEPYEGKLSSTGLGGGRAGTSPPPLDPWLVPICSPRSAPRRVGRTNLRSDALRLWRSPPPADRLLLILLGSAHVVVNEVSISQQLARRHRHFLHAGNNPERANAAQVPARLGANLRFDPCSAFPGNSVSITQ